MCSLPVALPDDLHILVVLGVLGLLQVLVQLELVLFLLDEKVQILLLISSLLPL